MSDFRKTEEELNEQTPPVEHEMEEDHNPSQIADEGNKMEGSIPIPAPEPSGPKLWSIDGNYR